MYQLGYDETNLLEFKGHSMRRTSATILADSGLSGQALRNKLNHNSESTVNEYISSSKRVQATNAGLLANLTDSTPDPKKPKVEHITR